MFHYFYLVATKKRSNANKDLSSALAEWANKHSLGNDVYVTRLQQALETGSDLEYWSQYDASEMMPFPEIKSGAKESARSELLISLRNIMVFVPVAFTWAGISQATTAFSKYSELNPNKIVNFFDFWENGYGVLSKFWTLSNIARVDFFLLSIVIAGSMGIAYLQSQAKILRSKSKNEIDQERLALCLDINEYLFRFRTPTAAVISQNLAGSIRELRGASTSLNKVMKSAEKNALELARGSVVRDQLASIKKLVEKLQK